MTTSFDDSILALVDLPIDSFNWLAITPTAIQSDHHLWVDDYR